MRYLPSRLGVTVRLSRRTSTWLSERMPLEMRTEHSVGGRSFVSADSSATCSRARWSCSAVISPSSTALRPTYVSGGAPADAPSLRSLYEVSLPMSLPLRVPPTFNLEYTPSFRGWGFSLKLE